MQKIISSSLSPNTEREDVLEALRVLSNPAFWQKGSAIDEVEKWFNGVSFDSGRSALFALLQVFDIEAGDEVLLQAFTCVAVPDSIRLSGAVPAYVDIDDRFNIDAKDLEKKITKQSKAIIIQHTFGVPARMDAILLIAKKHKLIVIEDCAHSLGATYKGKKVGTFGDAAFFSFGRDKVISSVWGGMATISQKSKVKSQKLREFQEKLPYPSSGWIAQQLFHPIAFSVILPTYNIVIGKIMLEAMKRMRLLSVPNPPSFYPRRYPNALAQLLLKQLVKLDRYNTQRRHIASYYGRALEGAIYLRYPMLVDDPVRVIEKAKRSGILLGNWYHDILDPNCSKSVEVARRIINLPTLISKDEARRVLAVLRPQPSDSEGSFFDSSTNVWYKRSI